MSLAAVALLPVLLPSLLNSLATWSGSTAIGAGGDAAEERDAVDDDADTAAELGCPSRTGWVRARVLDGRRGATAAALARFLFGPELLRGRFEDDEAGAARRGWSSVRPKAASLALLRAMLARRRFS